MADIDHFKNVNDLHGHLVGDHVLTEVAEKLKSRLRVYDGVGRIGGEEFLLILPGCDLKAAMMRADELRLFIANSDVAASGTTLAITLSMGVAIAEPAADFKIEVLLERADAALYEAKRKGRNQVQYQHSESFVGEPGSAK